MAIWKHESRLHEHHLKRELGLAEATFYGLGIIIGAGIYVLLGSAAGMAGNSVWLSFVMAAVIAAFTGLSYCELSSRFPHESAEYLYTSKAFGSRPLSFLTGWLLVITAAFSAATVAVGFAGYFTVFLAMPVPVMTLLLLVALSAVNFMGIRDSAELSMIFTVLQIAGLVVVVWAGLPYLGSVDYLATPEGVLPAGLGGVTAAASLVFFAYIGFDTIPKISDETRKPRKTIPRALLYSLVISTVLYIIVALSAVSMLPWQQLASSSSPLADAVAAATGPGWGSVVSAVALAATLSTVLIILVAGSRMIYGMAREGAMPAMLGWVHPRTRTPFMAVFAIMLLSMAFVYAGNITLLAGMTTMGMFIVFALVNASLIAVRMKPRGLLQPKPPFRVPLNIGRFPVLALLGVLASLVMLAQFEPDIYMYEAAALLSGLLLYGLMKQRKSAYVSGTGRKSVLQHA